MQHAVCAALLTRPIIRFHVALANAKPQSDRTGFWYVVYVCIQQCEASASSVPVVKLHDSIDEAPKIISFP